MALELLMVPLLVKWMIVKLWVIKPVSCRVISACLYSSWHTLTCAPSRVIDAGRQDWFFVSPKYMVASYLFLAMPGFLRLKISYKMADNRHHGRKTHMGALIKKPQTLHFRLKPASLTSMQVDSQVPVRVSQQCHQWVAVGNFVGFCPKKNRSGTTKPVCLLA